MKKIMFLLLTLGSLCTVAQKNSSVASPSWNFNSGIDAGAWWGGTGLSSLKASDNPDISTNLTTMVAYSGDFYLEWIHRKADVKNKADMGIKVKMVWDYFSANNGQNTGNSYESETLNYVNIPVLFEYCISFKNKVTGARSWGSSSNTQTSVYDHSYYQHVITTTTTTPGGYNPGGVPFSNAIFLYAGPQLCYSIGAFHNINGNTSKISNANFKSTYAGLIGGVCFNLNHINFDLSYQQGLTPIYSGENLYIKGFFAKIGFNLSRRKYY
jgi:hypothetical protein